MSKWNIEVTSSKKGMVCIYIKNTPKVNGMSLKEVQEELVDAIQGNRKLKVEKASKKGSTYKISTKLEYNRDEAEFVRREICECADDDKGYKIKSDEINITEEKKGYWDICILKGEKGTDIWIKKSPIVNGKPLKKTFLLKLVKCKDLKIAKIALSKGKLLSSIRFSKAEKDMDEIDKIKDKIIEYSNKLEYGVEEKDIYIQKDSIENDDYDEEENDPWVIKRKGRWEIVISKRLKDGKLCIYINKIPKLTNGASKIPFKEIQEGLVNALQKNKKIQVAKVIKKGEKCKLISKSGWDLKIAKVTKESIIDWAEEQGYPMESRAVRISELKVKGRWNIYLDSYINNDSKAENGVVKTRYCVIHVIDVPSIEGYKPTEIMYSLVEAMENDKLLYVNKDKVTNNKGFHLPTSLVLGYTNQSGYDDSSVEYVKNSITKIAKKLGFKIMKDEISVEEPEE